jgi:hypothetical protein
VNYGDLKSSFTSILNRRDITASQITLFMDMGTRRIQRSLRVPPMERLYVHTSDGSGVIPVPTDLLQIISISMNASSYSHRLIKSDLETILAYQVTSDNPKFYCRSGSGWLIGPKAPADAVIHVRYYGEFEPLTTDNSVNWLTLACPDLLLYSALTFSSDYFLDDRKSIFELRFVQIMDELMLQDFNDELEGGSIGLRSYEDD